MALILFLVISLPLSAQEIIPLWPDGAPFHESENHEEQPNLTVYRPDQENASNTAVIILPGGGYSHLAMDHEGYQVAEMLNGMGITAFILRYRRGKDYPHPVPLTDAQRAIRLVRARADSWNIESRQIGILGFSAGGHLASTTGTHFDSGNTDSEEKVERASSRPDFMILIYPVISMIEDFTHSGSRNNLLGAAPDPELVERLSTERQITPETPPTFLVHSSNDEAVPVENSIHFYMGLRKAGVPAEMHIYKEGPHGFGLAPDNPLLSSWPELLETWLRHGGMLD